MPQRTGRMDGRCAYCDKKMWINGFLGGEVVCTPCSRNNDEFLFKKHHFYDALTIQVYWRLHKGKHSSYYNLWKQRKI